MAGPQHPLHEQGCTAPARDVATLTSTHALSALCRLHAYSSFPSTLTVPSTLCVVAALHRARGRQALPDGGVPQASAPPLHLLLAVPGTNAAAAHAPPAGVPGGGLPGGVVPRSGVPGVPGEPPPWVFLRLGPKVYATQPERGLVSGASQPGAYRLRQLPAGGGQRRRAHRANRTRLLLRLTA